MRPERHHSAFCKTAILTPCVPNATTAFFSDRYSPGDASARRQLS